MGLVADRLQRDAVLIEISQVYAQMARERITDDAPLLAEVRPDDLRLVAPRGSAGERLSRDGYVRASARLLLIPRFALPPATQPKAQGRLW